MFKYKIGETYYSLDDLSGWNTWDSGNAGKLTLNNLSTYYIENGAVKTQPLVLAKPLEDWRSTTIPGYQIYSSSTNTYEPLKVLQAESIPNPSPNYCFATITSSVATIYPGADNKLVINYNNGASTESKTIYSKEISSKPIIPSWIIFELQAGGGGGGGTDSSDSKNGSGGGGGGYISGLLKLNFSVYAKYEIQVGTGGTGGSGESGKNSGTSGGGSYIYGVNSNGLKTLLVAAYGGAGGFSNNNNWNGKTPAAGGIAYVADSNYIKNAKLIAGGTGGQTNAVGACYGADVTGQRIYYLNSDFSSYYTNSYFYKDITTQEGGNAGSSDHSGGGGASALGPGAAGGGTDSDGNSPTSGYGGGGGGGRWSFWGTDHKGGDGKGGCCKLYY